MNEHPASLRGADGSRADLHSLVVLEHNTYVCRGSNACGSEKSGDDNMLNHSDLLIRCSHDSRRKATFRGRVITAIRPSDRTAPGFPPTHRRSGLPHRALTPTPSTLLRAS